MVNVGENRARNGVTDSPKLRNEGKFQSMELLDLSRYATERLRTLRAIPYKTWTPPSNHRTGDLKPARRFDGSAKGAVRDAVSENAVIVLARHGCCMSHVVKRLLIGHGVNPSVFEFQEEEENDVVKEIEMIGAGSDGITRELQFPAVVHRRTDVRWIGSGDGDAYLR
ncbi:hypothetical protein E3N88_45784 [Mikania micrantha]|uniref:Uncharacterized protein n=1 Tax=Mikania micrantha TaxID=192012 RepID=A0A5N6L875_9ASTR|nr:hypothetical protein E3N88_45784 [Mikania micrantha]